MKIILFIGHHKVGSTSLQTYLARNYYPLLRHGILYPSVLPPDRGRDLKVWAARRLKAGPVPLMVREAHSVLAQQLLAEAGGPPLPPWFKHAPPSKEMLSRIEAQIERFKPQTLVLCSETFSNFAMDGRAPLERLTSFVGSAEVKVLCTLRRPDDYLQSWHLQRLKYGTKLKPLRDDGLAPYLGSTHFDYAFMLRPWVEAFGASHVSLSNYSDTLTSGGSIQNFWAQSGLTPPPGLKPVPRANSSISPSASEIIRRANFELSEDLRQTFWRWMVAQNAHFQGPPNREVEMFGAKNRDVIAQQFQPVHDYLKQLTGQGPFFEDIARMTDLKPVADVEASRRILPHVRKQARSAALAPEILAFLDDLVL